MGGIILLGVEEHLNAPTLEERFTIVGVPNHEKRIKESLNTVNSEKVNHNVLKAWNYYKWKTPTLCQGTQLMQVELTL